MKKTLRFCCCFGRNSISSGMYRRMSSPMAAARHSSASQNLRISSLGSLLLMCSGALSKMFANETDIGTCSLSNCISWIACLRLLVSSNASRRHRTLWHAEKCPFSFSDTVVFLWNHAPNTRSVRNPRQESLSFYPTFLQTASLVSALSCLALFFRKRPLPCAVLENTLASHANGSHGTETPRLFPNKNHPLDILQFFFPQLGHTFDDGYAHPSVGPRVPSSWPPFPHTPCGRRTLFRNQFQAARFALLDTPPLVQTSACRRKWHALVNLAWHSAHA